MPNSAKHDNKAAFDLKGTSFTILVLSLRKNDLDAAAVQLAEKVRQAADFFHNAPVVINLQHLDEEEQIDLAMLVSIVRAQGFIPVGITGCTEQQKHQAAAMELAVLTTRAGGRGQEEEPEEFVAEEPVLIPLPAAQEKPITATDTSLILTEPVRSGQSVTVEQGDLTVMASVGSGAEITAPGNIHVYGTLRGRAFAGCNGSPKARIFCQRLEAELVSIAGIHLVSEDFPAHLRSKAVHIRLHGGRLHITAL
jgi:septum site-determining protein MinC